MDMDPRSFGIGGAALATLTIVVLDVLYPRRVSLPRSGDTSDEQPDFTSGHGSTHTHPRERLLFRLGLTTASIEYAFFAAWGFVVEREDFERMLLALTFGAAIALALVANVPCDSPRRAVHGGAAVAFFLLASIVAGGFGLTLEGHPRTALHVLLMIFLPIVGTLAVTTYKGRRGGVEFFTVPSSDNAALRYVESFAAILVGAMLLVIAVGWTP